MARQDLVEAHVVPAGEGPRRERGQDVGVGAGRWPGVALPAFGQGEGSTLAALAARAPRLGPGLRLTAAEPAGMLERHAQSDRRAAVGAGVDLRQAEIR